MRLILPMVAHSSHLIFGWTQWLAIHLISSLVVVENSFIAILTWPLFNFKPARTYFFEKEHKVPTTEHASSNASPLEQDIDVIPLEGDELVKLGAQGTA